MHYLITFYKPTSPARKLTEQLRDKPAADRWKKLVEANGYTVEKTEKITKGGDK